LSAELNSRSPEDIRAISDQGLPTELLPFVSSTNTVLNRIAVVLEQQRRFVADAAHELRSPLTALTLQTKNLTLQEMSEEAHQRVEEFDRGLKRANDLVDQLLTMARAQLAEPQRIAQVSLEQTVKVVFEELIPFADTKKIRLSFTQPSTMSPVLSGATQTDWITLVRNLVDNAIRYSSAQGRVEVAVAADENQITIDVIDNGPGIAVQERERVFDSFYRVLGTEQSGSGLGLSIVKSIVTTVHGDISLAFSDPVAQTGTIVSVKIPQAKQIA
jgi:two-component system OmpR family sensor kinase